MPNTYDRKKMFENLQNMTEEDAFINASNDMANPPLTDKQLADGIIASELPNIPNLTLLERYRLACRKTPKVSITVRYDEDVVSWYKAKGKGYQTMMNAALRACMEAEISGSLHFPDKKAPA